MKKLWIAFTLLILFGSMAILARVQADEGKNEYEEDHHFYEHGKWHGEDGDDEEHEDGEDRMEYIQREREAGENDGRNPEIYLYNDSNRNWGNSRWYFWTRDLTPGDGNLPFNETKRIKITSSLSDQPLSAYLIPMDGQVFAPGKKLSAFLGAETAFFKKSRILDVKKGDTELIFRAGSNAVYEDRVKTPMPAKAFYMNGDVYIPICVIANGLGFSVEWDEKTETISLQNLNQGGENE